MNHQQYKEWLHLHAYEDLAERDRTLLEEHLTGCAECRQELEQIKRLHRLMNNQAQTPSESLLKEARLELRAALRAERSKPTASDRPHVWFSFWKPALSYAAVLAIGVLAGYFAFHGQPANRVSGNTVPPPTDEMEITNVRFLDADFTDGQVEFAFDATRPMRVKGKMSDPKVQEILTYAMVKEQNPGTRLRAVNAISSTRQTDPLIKAALLVTLRMDENDGVRKEALNVLQKYPFDKELQQAFVFVLQNDPNPAMRIEAIKILQSKNLESNEMITVLKDRMKTDENSYIRRTATEMLEEVEQ